MIVRNRIELLDIARGIALVAMTIFHFGFDMQLLGFQEPGYIEQPHWKYFARSIASSFLFLTGFSLYLAHGAGIRWGSWRWRFLKIVAAAILITVATFFATPSQYIFFGILHAIAFVSLAGLLFMRVHWFVLILIAIGIYFVGYYVRTDLLNHPVWYWTGLSEVRPSSSDYVPVFPWMAAPLLGIAFAKFSEERNWLEIFAKPKLNNFPANLMKLIGRNSLIYYLAHQPIMLAVIVSFSWAMGWISFN